MPLKKYAAHPVVITIFLILAFEVVMRVIFGGVQPMNFLAYFICLCFSICLWTFLYQVLRLLPNFLQYIFAFILAVSFAGILVSNTVLYKYFGEYVTGHMLLFLTRDESLYTYATLFLLDWKIVISLPFIFFGYSIWNPKRARELFPFHRWKRIFIAFVSLLVGLVLLNQVRFETINKSKLVDSAVVMAFDNLHLGLYTRGLRPSVRERVEKVEVRKNAPDLFLFIGESWSKPMVSFYGFERNTMPFMKDLFTGSQDQSFIFSAAYTNTGATDVSLPSIFSGVGPEEGDKKLHDMPLMWDWLKKAGYKTILISPQKFGFAHMDQFINTPGPDIFIPAERLEGKIVNDNGIDDMIAANKVDEVLNRIDSNQPILLVFFNNALHFPFLQSSPLMTTQPQFPTAYENSLFITDYVVKTILESWRKHRSFDNTLMWFTADHGEVQVNPRKLPRIASFYREIVNIPFAIRLPKNFASENPVAYRNLKENLHANVENLDILPTMLALTDLTKNSKNQEMIGKLEGQNLFLPSDPHRPVVTLNTNEIRQWVPEGFSITQDQQRFVFSNVELTQLFDIAADPGETKNVWPTLPAEQQQHYLGMIKSNPSLARVYNQYQK